MYLYIIYMILYDFYVILYDLMKPLGLSEVSRTGVVAIARGTEKM